MTLAVDEETRRISELAETAHRKVDAAWELVIMTREEMKSRNERPFWKKIFG
jgi:hypothetical protein